VKEFAALFAALDETTRTTAKVDAMTSYFRTAQPADSAWAVQFLSGNRLTRLIPVRALAGWAAEVADVPEWLFEECYFAVGDLAETISLLLPAATHRSDATLHEWVENRILPLSRMSEEQRRAEVTRAWSELEGADRFVYNKLITGGFRVGVSRALVTRAVARATGLEEGVVAHRLSGSRLPHGRSWSRERPTTLTSHGHIHSTLHTPWREHWRR
jgi:DNA ligase 1